MLRYKKYIFQIVQTTLLYHFFVDKTYIPLLKTKLLIKKLKFWK